MAKIIYVVEYPYLLGTKNIIDRTNNERVKLALGMSNLCTYLISRLLKIKMKYEDIFHEKLNINDKVIENAIDNTKVI